jgi:hypothetical protein
MIGYDTHVDQVSSYLRRAVLDNDAVVAAAVEKLRAIPFDTIVCRGLSGILVAPQVARKLGKSILCVRKSDNHHGISDAEGQLGREWIFFDDFYSLGRTLQACTLVVKGIADRNNGFESTYVGRYEYKYDLFSFCEERFPRQYREEKPTAPAGMISPDDPGLSKWFDYVKQDLEQSDYDRLRMVARRKQAAEERRP